MNVKVRNKLIISEYPKELTDWCRKNLVLDNPDYHKKERMGLWVVDTPKNIWLFEQVGNELHIPFGCVKNLYNEFGDEIVFDYQIKPLRAVDYQSGINLYPYQSKAVEAVLKAKNGILVMPTGSGKTQTALEIIARVGGRALWLTHTKDLLNQSLERARSVLMCDDSCYGKITAGKVDIGSGITFATVQTMCKINLSEYRDVFDIVVVDEVQRVSGSPTKITQFYKVLSALSARYKIGLTATPKRADGLEKCMFSLLGDIIYEVKRKEVADKICPVKVFPYETNYIPNYNVILMGDGTLDTTKLVFDIVHNEGRYDFVFQKVMEAGKCILVLANRVEYLQRMSRDYNKHGGKSICISGLGKTKQEKLLRKKSLQELNSGKLDAIFGTYQIASEGLDVPNLRCVIFATPQKNEVTTIQSVGRVCRKADGKEYGIVIDFVDDFGLLRKWYNDRCNYYRKIDAEVL